MVRNHDLIPTFSHKHPEDAMPVQRSDKPISNPQPKGAKQSNLPSLIPPAPGDDTPTVSAAKCPTATKAKVKGNLPERECMDSKVHIAHGWFSHVLNKEAWCEGTGIPTPYNGTPLVGGSKPNSVTVKSTIKPKIDYTIPCENGDVWREDYTVPITVKEARAIAFHMHRDQKDKANKPYHEHLEGVRLGVVVLGGDEDEQIAALFHDAVEDFHTTYDMLKKIGCSDKTIDIVKAVNKGNLAQEAFLAQVIKGGAGAMRVNLADLLHNTRHDRVKALLDVPGKGQATIDRLLKKYRPRIARLMLELEIIVDEDTQKKLATKPIGSSTGTTYGGYSSSTSATTTSYDVDNLFPGDWMTSTPAPVLFHIDTDEDYDEGTGRVRYLLCNGEVWSEDLYWSKRTKHTPATRAKKKRSVYSRTTWEENTSIKFSGITEDDIADFIDVLNSRPRPQAEDYFCDGTWMLDDELTFAQHEPWHAGEDVADPDNPLDLSDKEWSGWTDADLAEWAGGM